MLTGDDVDLGALPIQTCWPGDAGAVHHAAGRDHAGPAARASRNVGMYRMQVLDRALDRACTGRSTRTAAPTTSPPTGGSRSPSRSGSTRSPPTRASAPLPKHIDEFMLAGFLKRRAGRARAGEDRRPRGARRTPRSCSRATSSRARSAQEGPFGDHTGYYTAAEPFPVFHLTAITMRRDAIYPSIVVGKPPQEDAWLGKATERIFLPAIRMTVPEIVDYDLPVAGAFHNCVIVSIRKAFPGHAHKVMHAIWGLGMLSLTKAVVVVDAHVDVHDYARGLLLRRRQRRSRRATSCSPKGPLDHLDHAPTLQFVGGKLGIDATAKSPAEGAREWPREIEMSDEVRELVDRRWDEYGIPAHRRRRSGAEWRSARRLRQLLRR